MLVGTQVNATLKEKIDKAWRSNAKYRSRADWIREAIMEKLRVKK